jgi:hypothetical protein
MWRFISLCSVSLNSDHRRYMAKQTGHSISRRHIQPSVEGFVSAVVARSCTSSTVTWSGSDQDVYRKAHPQARKIPAARGPEWHSATAVRNMPKLRMSISCASIIAVDNRRLNSLTWGNEGFECNRDLAPTITIGCPALQHRKLTRNPNYCLYPRNHSITRW